MGAVQVNEVFKAKDIILGKAEILDVFADVTKVDDDYKKEMAAEKNREINAIKAYLAKNKINAVQSPDGVFVVVKEAGDATNKIDSTKIASVAALPAKNARCRTTRAARLRAPPA